MHDNIYFLHDEALSADGRLLLDTGKPVMVMVQADWCGHCKRAKPAYQQLADECSSTVTCATVNAGSDSSDSEKALVKRLGVRGFPTFLLYVNGVKKDIDIKSRDVEGFKTSLRKAGVRV